MASLPLCRFLTALCLALLAPVLVASNSQASKPAYKITAVRAQLYYETLNKFSPDVFTAKDMALFNVGIGEGGIEGPASNVLVTIEVSGAPESYPQGKVKVHRMVLALNCGHAVNPDQIAAQVEGSVAYGLSATFYGECSIDKGRVQELNFHTYQLLRLSEMPKIETVIVPTYDFWGGVGEPTICVVAPAVMNAIHAATGKPVRSLPLKNLNLA